MTTYIPFTPQRSQAFLFSATLDNQGTTCQVPWSLFGNRWYLSVKDQNGNLSVFRALVSSPDKIQISSLKWNEKTGVAVETFTPHEFEFMSTCNLTLSGIIPDLLNRVWPCFITGPTTFTFPLAISPGEITVLGQVSSGINLVANYYFNSTMVFRQNTKMFEITP
jgi:hypothetical protein